MGCQLPASEVGTTTSNEISTSLTICRVSVGISEAYGHIGITTHSSHLTGTGGIITTLSGEDPQRESPFARHQLQLQIIEYMIYIYKYKYY